MIRHTARLLLLLTFLGAFAGCHTVEDIEDETTDWSAQQIFEAGKTALDDKKYEKAIGYFERLEARYPYGPYAAQAQLETAFAYYKYDEPESAIAAADRFIKLHPTHPNVAYAWYLKGLVNFADKRGAFDFLGTETDLSDRDPRAAKESFDAFSTLVERYPNSKYAEDARARLAYLLNSLASHDIHVANFYYERDAWVATVNRAKYVIERYPSTPSVEEALVLMAKSYEKMGLHQLADDSVRVLRKNYPQNDYLKDIAKR